MARQAEGTLLPVSTETVVVRAATLHPAARVPRAPNPRDRFRRHSKPHPAAAAPRATAGASSRRPRVTMRAVLPEPMHRAGATGIGPRRAQVRAIRAAHLRATHRVTVLLKVAAAQAHRGRN